MCRRNIINSNNTTKISTNGTTNNNNTMLQQQPQRSRTCNKSSSSSSSLLLLTHDSFVFPELEEEPHHESKIRMMIDKDDANKRLRLQSNYHNKNPHFYGLGGPTLYATLSTVAFYVALLFLVEHAAKTLLRRYAHASSHASADDDDVAIFQRLLHESPHNVGILARHVSVDFLSLLACSYVAISNRRVCSEIIRHFCGSVAAAGRRRGRRRREEEEEKLPKQPRRSSTETTNTTVITATPLMHESGYEERIFKYHPGAQRLCTFFLAYQVKNLYDTIYWNDGIEFVLHHLFAGAAAWGGMYPGCCHFYAIFYFGFSEISTAVLCLLANFDPKYGIAGLDRVFPKTKLVLGGLFVLSFAACRLILWPYATYFFARDALRAMRSREDAVPRARGRRGYLRIIYGCCVVLTLIQLLFVGMIIQTGREEIAKLYYS